MTDAPPPPPAPSLTPPEHFQFPTQLLEQWVDLSASEKLNVTLTRQDVDNLIFGLLRSGDAQEALSQALVAWSNGQVENANHQLNQFRKHNVDSLNYYRQFATGIMVSALRKKTDAK
jgi:hypothetical protein